jgi:hypothetical protein
VSQDSFGEWRVVNSDSAVIAWTATKEVAEEIIEAHNKKDPIQTYDDWLEYRNDRA